MSSVTGITTYQSQYNEQKSASVRMLAVGSRVNATDDQDYGRRVQDNDRDNQGTADVADLGNSRGLLPSAATIMSILEEKVNKRIEATFSETKVEKPAQNDYWSPENTGERIARFALKFYDRYSATHGGESEKNLESFLNLVGGAIDQGFGEAKKAISDVSGGDVPSDKGSTIDRTRSRVTDILEEFRKTTLERLRQGQPQDQTAATENGGTETSQSTTGGQSAASLPLTA